MFDKLGVFHLFWEKKVENAPKFDTFVLLKI